MATTSSRKVQNLKVQSSDGHVISADVRALLLSNKWAELIESLDDSAEPAAIEVKDVIGTTLKRVVTWCEQHKLDDPPVADVGLENPRRMQLPKWDNQFMSRMSNSELFDLINAAHSLDIKGLVTFSCKAVANLARGKTTEEMRELFGIPNPWDEPSTSTATWD